nr:hypothetical protein [Tanacetum cinerariifolium]
LEITHINNDPFFGILIPEVLSDQSSLTDIIHTIVHPDHQISEHNSKWTKDHPLENIIFQLARPVSTRLQLHKQALFCYYDAFLASVEPKTYKDPLTQFCWIEAMEEELNEFERHGNKARLVGRDYHQEEGIDFEESFASVARFILVELTSWVLFVQSQKCDDPIDAINHMMSFLNAVVTSCYPTTNNQLRNLSNPRKQATINNERVTLQLIQRRQTSLTASTTRTYTPGASGINSGKQRTVICYNYKGEDSCAQSVEIDHLKQTLSEHLKENESLMQRVTLLKNDFKKEESKNIDREIALEKRIKQLNNIVFKRDQSAQTIHMLTKPQFFYDHITKQALGFQNPFYLEKAQQLEPKLYDGNVIEKTNAIVIHDSKETLMLVEESRSKMLLKQNEPMMLEKKVNSTPIDYTVLNLLSQDFKTRFVPQTELSADQAFWSQNSMNSLEPTLSSRPTNVEVPKELPKVRMVNTSLKKLKHHLASFDVIVKERTTTTAITEDTWGFEHT